MNDHEKSHECVVPMKPGNKTARAVADPVEGRRSTAENPSQRNANRTQNRGNAPSGLERVREVAATLGYQVNPIARSLKTSRSETVAVLVPDLTNPLFPPIVRGIDGLKQIADDLQTVAVIEQPIAFESRVV